MAWVYLDDQFPDHPKVVAAGGDAGWLFVCGLAYCRRLGTDGTIPKAQLARLSDRRNPRKLALRLCDVGLWSEQKDAYAVHNYTEWNRPAESRSAAGKRAAQARWARKKGNANASESHSEEQSERTADPHASGCPKPFPLPSVEISSPPTEAPASSNGERKLMQAAARLLALRKADALGDQVRNADAFIATQTGVLYAQHRVEWLERLAHHPDLSSGQLADGAGRPPAERPETIAARKADQLHATEQLIEDRRSIPMAAKAEAESRIASLREAQQRARSNGRRGGDDAA